MVAEKTPMERAREAWAESICPSCGALKKSREHWFCRSCWALLPQEVQRPLNPQKLWKNWIVYWIEAVQILKGIISK